MAIEKNSDNSLGLDDILQQIGGNRGDQIDLISLASVMGVDTTPGNPIILPDTFVGKTVSLSATSLTTDPSSLTFNQVSSGFNVTVNTNGVFKILSAPSWISVDRTFGRGETVIFIFPENNNSLGSDTRNGNIVFIGSGNNTLKTLAVSQTGNPITATISPSSKTIVDSTSGSSTITLTLSNVISLGPVSIDDTNGWSLATLSTTTSGANNIYKYTLSREAGIATKRDTVFTANIFGDGFTSSLSVTFEQSALDTFTTADITISGFDVDSTGTITLPSVSPAYSSLSYSSGYNSSTGKFALVNTITTRTVTATVPIPDGYANTGGTALTKSMTAPQEAATTFEETDITITGFDVDQYGTISVPIFSPSGATIVYSTATDGGGTKVTPPSKFALVGTSTNRYCTVSYLVPDGYYNAGNTVSRTVSAPQEARVYSASQITFSTNFAVNYLGTITSPISSPTATAIVYSTTRNGTSVSSFSSVSSNTTRWCRVSVTVPSGYYNTGNTVTNYDITASQPFKATINVEPESHTFSNVGSYKDYTVASNTTWTVANYPSWITIDDTTGGGSDTKFRATATAQANPAVLRSSTLRAYTNTSANGTYSDYVSFSQPARANWSLSTIGNLGDTQWSVTNLTSTTASLVKFTFNIPYTFNFMDSNFDRTNFGFFVNNGAGYSTTSHTFTTGNKTFTLTANNNILPIANTISFDVGSVVSIAKRTYRLGIEGQVDEYMIGTVSGWNSSTKQLTVNISSTNNIQTNNNTVSYTSWEINQISGTGTSTTNFPRLYTRNENVSGAARTTTIKLDDTNDTYDQLTLSQTITQPLQDWSGNIYIAGQSVAVIGTTTYRYANLSASNTVLYMSVSVRTNYVQPITVTSDSLSGIWISTSSGGSATSSISTSSTTGTTTQFYIRWNSTSGGTMNVDISSTGNPTTTMFFNIVPVGGTGGNCLIEGTLVTLSDGTTTTIESLMMGQSVKSTVIDTLPQSDDADIVLPWSTQNLVTSDDSANVTGNTKSVVESIYNFNNGLIKSTESHGHFIKRGNDYMFKNAFNVEVGDYFVTENLEEILIEDIVIEFGEFNVYNLDVEENDLYIANGIITHNAIKAPNEK